MDVLGTVELDQTLLRAWQVQKLHLSKEKGCYRISQAIHTTSRATLPARSVASEGPCKDIREEPRTQYGTHERIDKHPSAQRSSVNSHTEHTRLDRIQSPRDIVAVACWYVTRHASLIGFNNQTTKQASKQAGGERSEDWESEGDYVCVRCRTNTHLKQLEVQLLA